MMYSILGVGMGTRNTTSYSIGSLRKKSESRERGQGAWGDEGWADLIRKAVTRHTVISDTVDSHILVSEE